MKIIIIGDSDGHFQAAQVTEREKVIRLLKDELQDGDYWANELDDILDQMGWKVLKEDDGWERVKWKDIKYNSLSEDIWLDFISYFIQRGSCEIIDL